MLNEAKRDERQFVQRSEISRHTPADLDVEPVKERASGATKQVFGWPP